MAEFYSPTIYKESRQLSPPSKDFVSVQLTSDELTLHHWRITPASLRLHDASASARTYRAPVKEFLAHGDLEDKIREFFGDQTLDAIKGRANGKIDHLNRLPDEAKTAILLRMPIEFLPLIRRDFIKNNFGKNYREFCLIGNCENRLIAYYLLNYHCLIVIG